MTEQQLQYVLNLFLGELERDSLNVTILLVKPRKLYLLSRN